MSTGAVEAEFDQHGDGKPQWCGQCDKRTRLIDRDGTLHRCRCNPRSHFRLAQYKECRICLAPVYEWEMRAHLADIHGETGSRT